MRTADGRVAAAATRRPASLSFWVGLTVFFHFAALPLLWRETPAIPSMLWTGLSTSLLTLSAWMMRNDLVADRSMTGSTVVFLIAYPILCVVSYLIQDQVSAVRAGLLFRNAQIMYLGLLLYLLGAAVRTCRTYRAVATAALLLAGYTLFEQNTFNMNAIYERSINEHVRPEYQAMGDAFAICVLLLLPRLKGTLVTIAAAALAVVVMFIIPSRSAAMFGTVGVAVSLILTGSKTTRVALIVAIVAGGIAYNTGILEESFKGTRFETVFSTERDTSWEVRQEIMEQGLKIIAAKPFTGEWAFQVGELKDAGLYVHNALNTWAQAGIIAFLLFILVWIFALRGLYRSWILLPRIAVEATPVLLFAALSWALARNSGNVVLFFCVGYAAAAFGRAAGIKPPRRRDRRSGTMDSDPLGNDT